MKPYIHPTADVHPGAETADDAHVGPYCIVGEGVRIGRGTRLLSHVTVQGITEMGEGNVVHSHAVIGSDPQDRKYRGEATRLIIGNGNVFREFVTVNRGTPGGRSATVLGDRNTLMALSHVAHDCELQSNIVLDNKVLLAGHVRIEEGATLGGRCAVHQFVTIGRCAFVGGMAGISQDVPPFMIAEGNPPYWILGVNVRGLERAGADGETIRALKEAYRILYRSGTLFTQSIEEVLRREGNYPEVQYLVKFLRASDDGKHGRALEAFRDRAHHDDDADQGVGGGPGG